MNADRDALVCDFAEYYHILDIRALPATTAATLAQGLPENSRSKRTASGMKISMETALLAVIADRLGLLVWMQTEDGRGGENRPTSILGLLNPAEELSEGFGSGDDFAKAWAELTGGMPNGD